LSDARCLSIPIHFVSQPTLTMKKFLRLTLSLVALALLCSCASGPRFDAVEISLVNLRFEQATPLETTGHFTIRVQNQSPNALRLEGGVHKIYLNGAYVGSGVSNESLEVARLSEGLQDVRVHLRNLAVARLVAGIIQNRRVEYRLNSLLYAQVEGRKSRVRLDRAGSLDLNDFQPPRPGGGPLRMPEPASSVP